MTNITYLAPATPRTVVLLDPTSTDGESALDELTTDDTNVVLVVLVSGRTSYALREFAAVENLYLADAGWTYLEQVANRVGLPGRAIEAIVASGPDAAAELAAIAAEREVARVLVPASLRRIDPVAADAIADRFGVLAV